MIKRIYEQQIIDWIKNGKDALLITGARQIGKTYLIRECLKNSGHSFVEFNFIEQKELIDAFSNVKSVENLLLRISLLSPIPLEKGNSIIFLDEVQECKEIMTMIKFLVEEGNYKYIMSGSLLGVELQDLRSAPVGYVQTIDMYPLTFIEFLSALNIQDSTIETLKNCYEKRMEVDSFIHEKMLDIFYLYLIVGGMPEAVSTYIETNNLQTVKNVHEKIIRFYKQDFTKYEQKNKLKLREIYDTMASELNAQNKRFKFNSLKEKSRYQQYEDDFLWLKNAGVALPVYNISQPVSPLILNENRKLFKLFYSDVGLLTSLYSDNVKIQILNKEKNINNGSLFENAVAQELYAKKFPLFYYNDKRQGELDFVIERNGNICPLEIKSGKSYKKHSALTNIMKNENYKIEECYIFSNHNIEVLDKFIYLPIYMIMFIENDKLRDSIYKLDLPGL